MENACSGQNGKRDFFTVLSICYLAFPNLIFLTTWIRPWIGIPAALVVAVCLIVVLRKDNQSLVRQSLDRKSMGFVVAIALLWTFLAGVGGFVPQSSDYIKHNLVLHDLVNSTWPVSYNLPIAGKSYLCYSLGYYLVPSSIARVFGDALLPSETFLWASLGVGLFFYWIATFNGRSNPNPRTTVLLFLMCASTGIVWYAFKLHAFSGVRDEMTTIGLVNSYFDNFTRLQFQPQHAITGWLGAAVLYELLWVQKNPKAAAFVWSLTLLWSVMTSIGLLLLPLAALKRVRLRDYMTPVNFIGGGFLVAIMGIYYQGHAGISYNAPIWKASAGADWPLFYLLFLIFQLSFVLLVYLIDLKYSILNEWRVLFVWSAVFLIMLPLYKVGFWGDLRMEAASPAMVFVALGAIHCFNIESFSIRKPLFLLFLSTFLIGAIYPAGKPWLNLITNRNDYSYAETVRTLGFHNLSEISDPSHPSFNAAEQYMGKNESVAARWLLR
jgi:hypothetical protein